MNFSISCFVKYDHLDYQSERMRHAKNACFGKQRTHASASKERMHNAAHLMTTILYTDKGGLILIKDELGDCHTLQRTQGSQTGCGMQRTHASAFGIQRTHASASNTDMDC
jgi:hypothetical protein